MKNINSVFNKSLLSVFYTATLSPLLYMVIMFPGIIHAMHTHEPGQQMKAQPPQMVSTGFEVSRCRRKQDTMHQGSIGDMKISNAAEGSKGMASHQMTHEKAHMDHTPKHGGEFFMAPDNKHHVEGVYSKECGFQLYIYDEYTKPLSVIGMQAFIVITEESADDDTGHIRFLSPTSDYQVLQSPLIQGHHSSPDLKGRFSIDLHLKLPGSDEPVLFNFSGSR